MPGCRPFSPGGPARRFTFLICHARLRRRERCRFCPTSLRLPLPGLAGRRKSFWMLVGYTLERRLVAAGPGRCPGRCRFGGGPRETFSLENCNTGASPAFEAGGSGRIGRNRGRGARAATARWRPADCGNRNGGRGRVAATGRGSCPSGHGGGRERINPLIGVFVIHERVGQPGKGHTAGNHGRGKDNLIDEHTGNLRLPVCIASAVPGPVRPRPGFGPPGAWDGAARN